jgi:hypothetical protein
MNPGDKEPVACSPGSIEQQLDMCEQGAIKSEDVIRHIDREENPNDPPTEDPIDLVHEINSFDYTMSERDREGDDLSGDEHSSGLQGDELEIEGQPNINSGVPGDLSLQPDRYENVVNIEEEKRRTQKRKKSK